MGTQSVQMKGVLPWLVRWTRYVSTRNFYPALAVLVCPRPATWAGSRAGLPVSEYVSLALYVRVEGWCEAISHIKNNAE